jgi:methylmalonyl-CoA carboxyltransferase large subunit
MATSTNDSETTELARVVDALRREVAALSERTAALERALARPAPQSAKSASPVTPAAGLSEEVVMAISAAIAAYLGVKPRIRQITLVSSQPWSQQGRVTIQASHALSVQHG